MWFDLAVAALEDLSREELIALAREQDARIAELVDRLARLEHLLSRNSSNSSMPPSRDDGGRTPPKPRSGGAAKRSRGKQPGAPGSNLAWREVPNQHLDRIPQGSYECGADVAAGRDRATYPTCGFGTVNTAVPQPPSGIAPEQENYRPVLQLPSTAVT